MPIIASGGDSKTFTPAPEGVHQAVCVDVIDLGMQKSAFADEKTGQPKMQRKVNIVWQIGETRDDGKRFQLYKRYTLSLHDKAVLRHDLESWRGRAFTFEELSGFDVETVKGANCLVNVQHKKSSDGTKTWANVVSVMPLIKGMPKLLPKDYVRPDPPKPEMVDHSSAGDNTDNVEYPENIDRELTDDDIPFAWLVPFLAPLAAAGLAAGALWS
jgi:hypothetical protein